MSTKTETKAGFDLPKGDMGDMGLQGTQGIKGDKGDTGNTGTQGIQGVKGDTGNPGNNSIANAIGITAVIFGVKEVYVAFDPPFTEPPTITASPINTINMPPVIFESDVDFARIQVTRNWTGEVFIHSIQTQ